MDDIRISEESLHGDMSISQEKGPILPFIRNFTSYRRGFAPNHFVDSTDKKFQLPDNSTLHFVTDFLKPNPKAGVNPDLSIPFVEREVWRKYYAMWGNIPNPDDPLFPVTDTHVFQKGPLRSGLIHFYNANPKYKRIVTDGSVGKLRNALLMYDYGILQRVNVPGTLRQYRLQDLILRSILQHIVTFPYRRNHFILIPLSDRYYARSKFFQAFHAIKNGTIKEKNDPSYDFLVHLFGFVYGLETPIKDVTFGSNDLKAIDNGTLELPNARSTSLFDRLNDDQLSMINIILEHKGECIIYNLKAIKDFTEKGAFYLQLYKHVMKLKSKSLSEEDKRAYEAELAAEGETPEIDETHESDADHDTHKLNFIPEGDKPLMKMATADETVPTKKEPPKVTIDNEVDLDEPQDPEDEEELLTDLEDESDELESEVTETTDEDTDVGPLDVDVSVTAYVESLPPAEQKRAKTLIKKLDTIKLGNRTLADHIATASRSLEKSNLVGDHVELIDESTRSTSITTFDKQYLAGNYHTDIAKTITSFMTQGFFVSDVTESKEIDRINRNTTYRVKFVSVDGKSHVVSFTVPDVNSDGIMIDNGVDYRLIKQKVSVPIAKVSPWRVALFSSYNKSTVERTRTRRSYGQYILKILETRVKAGDIKPKYGHLMIDSTPLPLEYSFIAERYSALTIKGYKFVFNYPNRFDGVAPDVVDVLHSYEAKYGVYCGMTPKKQYLFFGLSNQIVALNPDGSEVSNKTTFIAFLKEMFPDIKIPPVPYEYTLVKIISQNYSLIFLLGLTHGLTPTLKHINAHVRFIPKGKRLSLGPTECRIRFKDGTLVFNRYPLLQSFILSGLQWCDTESYNFDDFNHEDTYFDILESKGISTNQIKGIRSFFDLFIDPITRSVLESMGEPTNVTDLLIRATEMLTSQSHYPAASERHYRFRSYERFPSIIYNEIARSVATYKGDRTRGKRLDVNPQAVYQKIVSDPARIAVDTINPIHEIKDVTKGSYAGIGGRTSRSFVVNDRTYSPDSVGVISEATPDSGKVGMIFNTVMDPNIVDLYGKTIPHDPKDTVEGGAKLMSVVGNLLPGLAQDDGKRANFTSIQLSHHVPCENGEVNRIRTGTESLIAHMSGSAFAASAPFDGLVTGHDAKHKLIEVTPKAMVVKTVGKIDLSHKADAIDSSAKNHSFFRAYIPDGKYSVNQIFNLTKESVGLIAHIQEGIDPKDIPQSDVDHYKGKKLILVTFVLSPRVVIPNKTIFEYGEKYTSSQGTYLKQDLVVNVRVGDQVKKGDILVYNSGFFVPKTDPFGPGSNLGADWKHGVMANIALLETSSTYEDACAITDDFGKKLRMFPAHKRSIVLNRNTIVHQCVSVGDEVYSTDSAMTVEDGDLDIVGGVDDPDTVEFFNHLSQQRIKMKYHGRIAEVDFLYGGPLESIHPTLRKLITANEKQAYIKGRKMNKSEDELRAVSGYIQPGSKYGGVLFTEDTVIVEITVVEELNVGEGDKLCIMTSNKTVVSEVLEKPPITESGKVIDINFSVTSPYKRIVNSPFINGIGNQILEDAESIIVDLYDN